jgi:hypothetical protein
MQADLKLHLGIGIGPVNNISPPSLLLLAPGLERRPGQTTTHAAWPIAIACIAVNQRGP